MSGRGRPVKRNVNALRLLAKDKLETFEDCYNLVYGLSKKDVYKLAGRFMLTLAVEDPRFSPRKIVEYLNGRVEQNLI